MYGIYSSGLVCWDMAVPNTFISSPRSDIFPWAIPSANIAMEAMAYVYIYIMVVSQNRGTPKSSIFV